MSQKLSFTYLSKTFLNWQGLDFIRELRVNPAINKELLTDITHISPIEQEAWYQGYIKDPDHEIYLVSNTLHGNVGYIQLHVESYIHGRYEVGYIVDPESQGHGYGEQMIQWSLQEYPKLKWQEGLKLRRAWLTVLPTNKKAIALYKKQGFKQEALMKGYALRANKSTDVVLMARLV